MRGGVSQAEAREGRYTEKIENGIYKLMTRIHVVQLEEGRYFHDKTTQTRKFLTGHDQYRSLGKEHADNCGR